MSLEDINVSLVENLDDALEFKRWLGQRHEGDAIAVDTETTGLDQRAPGAKIRLIQFGDTQHGWSLPWEDWRGVALEALNQWTGTIVMHNSAFDMKWLHHHGPYRMPLDRTVDTMIGAHIINPLGSGALKSLSVEHIDKRAALGQNMLAHAFVEHGWDWSTVPINFGPYWQYSSLDTVLTARIWKKFSKDLLGTYRDVFDLEMAVRFVASRMEERGARVDLEYSRRKHDELQEYALALKAWAKENYGILLSSNPALAKKIIELGGEFQSFTEKGAPKVDKDTLKYFADPDNGFDPALQALTREARNYRQAQKFASTYFEAFLTKAYGDTIHADIRTLGARTGRQSISGIPLQQLPKGNALIRNAIIASDGCQIVTCDYDQIEGRILASVAEDVGLSEAFRIADTEGGDFFVELGKQVYHAPDFQKSDKRRSLVKSMFYGLLYGAGTAKMAETAGVPVDKMQESVDSLHARFPGIRKFMSTVEDTGMRRKFAEGEAYVVTPLGRRLPADPGREYTLVNYFIQSSAADVLKRALVALDAAGYGDWMVMPVHDEVVFDIPEEHVAQAVQEIPELMADTSYRVPLTASAEGPFTRWGEKYE